MSCGGVFQRPGSDISVTVQRGMCLVSSGHSEEASVSAAEPGSVRTRVDRDHWKEIGALTEIESSKDVRKASYKVVPEEDLGMRMH